MGMFGHGGAREDGMSERTVTAALVIIGNEILSGRTRDENLAFLAQTLNEIGIQLREARVVPDAEADIVEAVNALRAKHDHVFTTGGIGPTHDDITSASVAKAMGLPFGFHPEAERRLRAYYPPEKLNDARLKMAQTPEGAVLIDNPVSVAPGFTIGNVHVLPGVPLILQAMFAGLKPRLQGGAVVQSRTITVLCPEGDMAKPLAEIQAAHPTVEIGSYPFMRQGSFGTSLVLRSVDEAVITSTADAILAVVRQRGVEVLDLF
jgi:molybdenum cofactor synthesis domain-containing protein